MIDFDWDITPLTRAHKVSDFDCGDEELNRYIRQFADQHGRRGVSRTFVACPVADRTRIIGYFTISTASVAAEAAVTDENLPRHPIPVMHLGRFAVAAEFQGQGSIGPGMLGEVYDIALTLSERVGCYAIDVLAKTDRAKRFYERQGFIQLKDSDLHLWLRLKDIRASKIG